MLATELASASSESAASDILGTGVFLAILPDADPIRSAFHGGRFEPHGAAPCWHRRQEIAAPGPRLAGSLTTTAIGAILLAAVGFNVDFVKNKGNLLQKVYVSPVLSSSPSHPRLSAAVARSSPSDRLKNAGRWRSIASRVRRTLSSTATIISIPSIATARSSAFVLPEYDQRQEFARIGGSAWHSIARRTCLVCVAGMGFMA
ncbi:hypothetical protein RAD15_19065 [Bradyrhizobium sp. 14AA]